MIAPGGRRFANRYVSLPSPSPKRVNRTLIGGVRTHAATLVKAIANFTTFGKPE